MTNHKRERYDSIRQQWPALFTNPPWAPYTVLVESSLVREAEADEEARLAQKGLPIAWSRTGVVYEDPYMIVVRDAVRRPDGSLGTYVRTLRASGMPGSAVLPMLQEQVVLVRHFRHATRTWHLEIPRGFGEPGVNADQQARLELREEIGAEADTLVELGVFHSNNGLAATTSNFSWPISTDSATPKPAKGSPISSFISRSTLRNSYVPA